MYRQIFYYILFVIVLISAILLRVNIDAKADMLNSLTDYIFHNDNSRFDIIPELEKNVDIDLTFNLIKVIEPYYKIINKGNAFYLKFFFEGKESFTVELQIVRTNSGYELIGINGYDELMEKYDCIMRSN